MKIVVERDGVDLAKKAESFLREKTAEHNLMLNLISRSADGKYDDIVGFLCYEGEELISIAMQTPPHNLVLSEQNGTVDMQSLAQSVADEGLELPGVLGPVKAVEQFVPAYTEKTKQKFEKFLDQFLYALTEVTFPQNVAGEFVWATMEDHALVAQWKIDFANEALGEGEKRPDEEIRRKAEEAIKEKRVGLWKVKGKAVSLSGCYRVGDMGRIGPVYTPPEYRGKGYGSAVVAAVSQQLLDEGIKMCCLYTDAGNPTSNSIYQKIGYCLVTDSVYYLKVKK